MDTNKAKVAEYLCALDAQACLDYCSKCGLLFFDTLPFEFQGPDDVYDCLRLFLEEGISPHYIFKDASFGVPI